MVTRDELLGYIVLLIRLILFKWMLPSLVELLDRVCSDELGVLAPLASEVVLGPLHPRAHFMTTIRDAEEVADETRTGEMVSPNEDGDELLVLGPSTSVHVVVVP